MSLRVAVIAFTLVVVFFSRFFFLFIFVFFLIVIWLTSQKDIESYQVVGRSEIGRWGDISVHAQMIRFVAQIRRWTHS